MKLHGSTEGNLLSAIRSASRLRERPVHADTVKFWSDLIVHARSELSACATMQPEALKGLIAQLELEVERRQRAIDQPLKQKLASRHRAAIQSS
jgi:hypothetical protein